MLLTPMLIREMLKTDEGRQQLVQGLMSGKHVIPDQFMRHGKYWVTLIDWPWLQIKIAKTATVAEVIDFDGEVIMTLEG